MDNVFNSKSNKMNLLLAYAAQFHGTFSIDWLEELTGLKPSEILSVFENETQQGLVTKREPGIYCFADFKKRQIILKNLGQDEKEQLNRSIVNLLVRELPDTDSKSLVIVPHLLSISNHCNNYEWLMRAGHVQLKAFNTEEAARCFTKVIDDLSCLKGERVDRLFIEASLEYSKISAARHDTSKVISILQDAMLRAKRLGEQGNLALLKMHMAKNEWLRSLHQKALNLFEQGWSLTKELNDPALLRSASIFSTYFLYYQGRFREIIQIYENSREYLKRSLQDQFSLLAAITVSRCYARTGKPTKGLRMLDAIRTQCLKRGDFYMAAHASAAIGVTMLDIRQVDDALKYLKSSLKEANKEHNYWIMLMAKFMLALAYYLKGQKKRSINYLREFLKHSRKARVNVQLFPYIMEISWAMEEGKIPKINDLSILSELRRATRSKNIFMKGVSYRYKAYLQKRDGLTRDKIIQSLKYSLRYLEESGHKIELAKSQLELAREYFLTGDEGKGKEMAVKAIKILSPINVALVPDDLKPFIKDQPFDEILLKEITDLGKEMVAIRDNNELFQLIISTASRVTGAERGAIFIVDEGKDSRNYKILASKNLEFEQTTHPRFLSSNKVIEEVALSGKSRIVGISSVEDFGSPSSETIRSRICVPMHLNEKVIGAICLDNRLLRNVFKESHLELLEYFAALTSLALGKEMAEKESQRLRQIFYKEDNDHQRSNLGTANFEGIIGESPGIRQVIAHINQVAHTDTAVLILGETGAGKELVAKAIHNRSPRHDKPFIIVHCSALPENLITSELFGHERGAFTGADHRRIGRFELAHEGTLFLDEIGELPLEIQVRLLRVLESKEFERVGGSAIIHSDFRLVAATNKDLEREVKAGRFRDDLYYRINVFPIFVPPLKERREDIPLLTHYFARNYAMKLGKAFKKIPDEEIDKLIRYDWPGNVRELENVIEKGIILSFGSLFRIPDIQPDQQELPSTGIMNTLKENELQHILKVLHKTKWRIQGPGGAAEILDIHPSTLASRMKKLGIKKPKMPRPSYAIH